MELFSYSPENILKTEIGWCEPWCLKFNKNGTLKTFKIFKIHEKSNSFIPVNPKLQMEI